MKSAHNALQQYFWTFIFVNGQSIFDFVLRKFYFTEYSTRIAKVWTFYLHSDNVLLITDMHLTTVVTIWTKFYSTTFISFFM